MTSNYIIFVDNNNFLLSDMIGLLVAIMKRKQSDIVVSRIYDLYYVKANVSGKGKVVYIVAIFNVNIALNCIKSL